MSLPPGHARAAQLIDDRAIIPADAEHFTDCMHLADKGNEVMAERFYRGLRGLVATGVQAPGLSGPSPR